MTAKEYLRQIKRLNIRIKQRIEEKEALMNLNGVSSVRLDTDRVQTSPSGEAAYTRAVEKAIMLGIEIDRLTDELIDLKHLIIGQIQMMDNEIFEQILYKRYVEYKTLEQIAVDMNYSFDWVRHRHGAALQEFYRKYLE